MKVLIWLVCFFVATILNTILGYATGIKLGYIIFYFVVYFVAKKLCKKWDEHKATKKKRKELLRQNVSGERKTEVIDINKICFCRKCGERLIENSRFCRKCGTEVLNS